MDRFFPSSQLCHQCGWRWRDITPADRVFGCQNPTCGRCGDRDYNAAVNILNEALVAEASLYARLQHVAPASWRQVRQETRDRHREQPNRFRFRHRPLDYLASLETRWEQTTGTQVLPP